MLEGARELLIVVNGKVALVFGVGLGCTVRSGLAEAHDSELRRHVRSLDHRLLAFLESCLLLDSLAATCSPVHIEDELLRGQLFQGALHLLEVLAMTIVLLLAGGLGAHFILLSDAEAVSATVKIWDPLAV